MKALKIYLKDGSSHTFPLSAPNEETIKKQLVNNKFLYLDYGLERLIVLVENIQAIYVGKLEKKDADA